MDCPAGKEEPAMSFLVPYAKARRKSICASLLPVLIFTLIFLLFNLPLSVLLYAWGLCLFCLLIFLFTDFSAYKSRHLQLQLLRQEISITLENLPPASDIVEADYQALLEIVCTDKLQLVEQMDAQLNDLIEYYTMWAHQIKTPISAMRLLLQSEAALDKKELLDELQRIEQYVEMVLCYLRLDAGSTDYVIKQYDLDSIIRQAIRKYASQFIRRKIRLEYVPLNCSVLTDEKWLLFIIEQLLSNALKYTKSGKIEILLEEPKTLCIRDTGIGIAAEDLPRIFDKGFTGYNGHIDNKATGIGLYLCRRISENLGHKIRASSVVGHGTTMRIDLLSSELYVD